MSANVAFEKDISIIIVNYNVKEFLSNLLSSVHKATIDLNVEIIVVDNGSKDNSITYLKSKFPEVIYIENNINLGFGKANNLALKKATGKYVLFINPDTIIQENTLTILKRHMDRYPNTAAAGCKILNPDGTFALESRRSIPTPLSALWKILGLTTIFPKSKTFADYYLSWMDEDKPSQVPVLSGAFMFCRTEVLKKIGGFDEQFFMYGEDIDLCYRINQSGYNIDYIPETSIIHYKGESTKKDNIDYVVLFNKALYQFFRKHYNYGYSLFFRSLIIIGIFIRGLLHYFKTLFKSHIDLLIDITIINIVITTGFILRYQINFSSFFKEYNTLYLVINVLVTILFLLSAKYYNLYRIHRSSVTTIIKGVIISFSGVALITFFFRQFAFSRLILVGGTFASAFLLMMVRLVRKNLELDPYNMRGKFRNTSLLLVGNNEKTHELIRKIRSRVEWNYDIKGIISQIELISNQIENVPVVGNLTDLPFIVKNYKIDQVLFVQNAITYNDILSSIMKIQGASITFKIVPESLDFILGKSNVEYLEDIPIVDLELSYQRNWNQFIKRTFDLCISFLFLIITSWFFLPIVIIKKSGIQKKRIIDNQRNIVIRYLSPSVKNKWVNVYLMSWFVLNGVLSYVGSPLSSKMDDLPSYKPGITGLRQINEKRLYHEDEKKRFEIYYLQNYSIWLDLDIVLKTIIRKVNTFQYLDEPT